MSSFIMCNLFQKLIKYEIQCLKKSQFIYFGPQIKFCGWAYKVDDCIWNFMPISKNREKRNSIIEVQITT